MIAQKIFAFAKAGPDKTALIDDGVLTTYGDFARMIGGARAQLARENLPAHKSAIVLGRTFREQWTIVLALRALGIDTISVSNLKMANDLAIRNVSAVVVPRRDVPGLDRDVSRWVRVVSVADGTFAPADALPLPEPESVEKNGGYLVATSGTTGNYKKVFFAGAHEEESVRWTVDAFAFGQNTVFQGHNFPLYTGIGGRTFSAVWYAGGSVIMTRAMGIEGFFTHRPNKAILTPVMVGELLKDVGETGTQAHPDFELDVSGGFLPLSLAERVVKNITPKLNVLYGSTEVTALMRARFRSADDLHWLDEHKTNYEIVDEAGAPVPAGTEGELRIKLRPFDCQAYLDDTAATAKFFRGGYFYPGDLAIRREDGRIRVLGRTDDVINVKGYKIPAAPVEDAIERKLKVDAACVFSEMDDEGEVRVVVAVESDRSFSQAELAASVQGRKGFEDARFVVLKEFPRAATGMRKVNRRELRKLVT